jgi:glycosyltransferase involved in cell wall biosynthesis
MHVLLIHQAFASLDEAGGTRHYEMAVHLVEHGHQVTIISSPVSYLTGKSSSSHLRWKEQQIPQPGITILRAYTYQALHKSFIHRVFSFLSFMFSSFWIGLGVKNVDLVWGTSPPIFQGVSAWLLARLKRVPFLFEVRDLWPAFAIAVGVLKNRLLIHLSEGLERFLYRHADRLVVNSPGFIQYVSERGARRIELIPNGADPGMFTINESNREMRAQWGLADEFVVLYAGAHGMSNDLGLILDSAEQLLPHSNIRFVFVGDGKEKVNLQSNAIQRNLTNIIWAPPVPKNQMAQVLASADACIAILKPIEMYKTTYPNKVFDYMAAGRPVLLVIDGVIRQVVEAAGAGLFAQPGSPDALSKAVLQLANDPVQARQMGANGRDYVHQHFNRARLAENLMDLLEDMRREYA